MAIYDPGVINHLASREKHLASHLRVIRALGSWGGRRLRRRLFVGRRASRAAPRAQGLRGRKCGSAWVGGLEHVGVRKDKDYWCKAKCLNYLLRGGHLADGRHVQSVWIDGILKFHQNPMRLHTSRRTFTHPGIINRHGVL